MTPELKCSTLPVSKSIYQRERKKMYTTIWIGMIFIFGGAAVLLNQLNILPFGLNWWALFILFPSFGTLTSAYNRYRSTKDLFEMGVMIPALVGLFMLLLSVSLLVGDAIDLNLRVYWPIILIVLGLGLIIGRGRRL
jgi:fatty acid desaturase